MYATPVPTFANKPGTVPRKKDALTAGPRVKNALPPLTQPLPGEKKGAVLSRSMLNSLKEKTQEVFDESSQYSQVYVVEMRNIEERLSNRAQADDDSVQLAIRAADNDTRKALEAAKFFRDEAAEARQQSEMLMQRVLTLEQDNETLTRKLEKNGTMLNSIALDLYSDISTKTINKDMLLTQYSRIRLLVTDFNHISAEIGFPSTSVPEIVELLDPQALQNMTGDTLMIEGVPRTIQSISLSLTLAECQILRSLNFLLKHLISGHQQAMAQDSSNSQMAIELVTDKSGEDGSRSRISNGVSSGHSDHVIDDIVRQAMLVSPIMTQSQLQNPNDVFRIEFQGSGVAVAKALVELRRRTASFLLREARFNHDPLLKRTATDNTTLRTLVAALQNELYFTRQALEMVKGLGLSSEIFPFEHSSSVDSSIKLGDGELQSQFDTDTQSKEGLFAELSNTRFTPPTFSSTEVMKLAENALTSAVDLELLPSDITKRLEEIVENALAISDDVEKARESQHFSSEERISVTEIQKLIMLREKALQRVDEAAQELLDNINSTDIMGDINSKVGPSSLNTFTNVTCEEPSSLLSFAKDANETQAKLLARFSKEQTNFMGDLKQICRSLGEGHAEKYNRDGSGFQDILYRHAALLEHTLELHKIVVARNMALTQLQAIIVQLQSNNERNIREVAYLAALRNGILKGYLEQSRKLVVLRHENHNFRTHLAQIYVNGLSENEEKGRPDALLATIMDAAVTGNQEYCASLAHCVETLTQGYRTKIAECKAEMSTFGNTLVATSAKITQMLEAYRLMIETKACKLVQTDRKRRTFDMGVMTEEVESNNATAAKKK